MKLYSLYGYFATKFSTKDDTIIRKRLMAFPETQLLDLANTTLVIPNDYAGMKVVQFHHIDGFTHSTAVDTLLTPNYHTMPITIQHHHEYVLDELEHPELPLLAVRVGQGFGAAIDYEFVSCANLTQARSKLLVPTRTCLLSTNGGDQATGCDGRHLVAGNRLGKRRRRDWLRSCRRKSSDQACRQRRSEQN